MSIINEYSGQKFSFTVRDTSFCLQHITQNYIAPLLTMLTDDRVRSRVRGERMGIEAIYAAGTVLKEIEATLACDVPEANGVTREVLEDIYVSSVNMDWMDSKQVGRLRKKCDSYLEAYHAEIDSLKLAQKEKDACLPSVS